MKLGLTIAFVALATSRGAAWPCGSEDPSSVTMRRGFLNIAYPKRHSM